MKAFRTVLKGVAIFVLIATVSVVALVINGTSKLDESLGRRHAPPVLDISDEVSKAPVELGERIVQVRNGCVECHGKDLSGMVVVDDPVAARISGPNLTPAALADWTDDEIARAIRYGVKRDGSPAVLMPSHEYQYLSRGDLAATVAYLRTVPSIEKKNSPIEIGPLFKVLYGLGKLPTLVPAELVDVTAQFKVKPREEVSVEFGKYLVTSACVGCHGADLSGGPIPGGPPEWPPASDIRKKALAHWNQDQFVHAMRKGENPRGEKLRPPMPIALTQQMTDTELLAIWAYLDSLEI